MRASWSFVAIVVACACAGSSRAEEAPDPTVTPIVIDGRHTGCDLSVHLVRRNQSGDISSAVGITVEFQAIDPQHWGAALKIGYQPSSGIVLPPTDAFLISPNSSNEDEVGGKNPPDQYGYVFVKFVGGPHTSEAINNLASSGIEKISFRMPTSNTLDTWTLDLSHQDDVRARWRQCLSTVALGS